MKSLQSAQEDLDRYNYVGERTPLSYQNVSSLIPEAFRGSGKNPNQIFYTVAAISEDESLDDSLRDEILKFIGTDPQADQASIALVRGRINPTTAQIEGNTHWTALNLKRVVDDYGNVSIEINHMDSMGGVIPSAVTRVIKDIKKKELRSLAPDLQQNQSFQTALLISPNITFKKPVALDCPRQQDGYSCGYHTAFNLVRMHDGRFREQFILQGEKEVGVVDFISQGKLYLQGQFNARVNQARTSFTSKLSSKQSTSSVEDKKTLSQSSDITDLDTAVACVFSIIEDSKLGYIKKLEELLKIELELRDESSVENILSPLQIEKSYARVIGEFSESMRFLIFGKFQLNPASQSTFNRLFQIINSSDIINNLEKVIPFLKQLEILLKNLEKYNTTQQENSEILFSSKRITENPAEFLTNITQHTENLRTINDSILLNHEVKKPKTSPTPPLSAKRVEEIEKATEVVKKLIAGEKDVLPEIQQAFEKDVEDQKNKPKPELPYRGLGLAVKPVKQKVVCGKEVMVLKINEDFNPGSARFECDIGSRKSKNARITDLNLVGKYITWIEVNGRDVSIEEIFKNHGEDKSSARKDIASIFHGQGEIKFGVFDSITNKIIEVSCKREPKDIYVTSNCGFAKDKLGTKKGDLYNPDIHHVSDNIIKNASIELSHAH